MIPAATGDIEYRKKEGSKNSLLLVSFCFKANFPLSCKFNLRQTTVENLFWQHSAAAADCKTGIQNNTCSSFFGFYQQICSESLVMANYRSQDIECSKKVQNLFLTQKLLLSSKVQSHWGDPGAVSSNIPLKYLTSLPPLLISFKNRERAAQKLLFGKTTDFIVSATNKTTSGLNLEFVSMV